MRSDEVKGREVAAPMRARVLVATSRLSHVQRYILSNTAAMPCPPPMHIVTSA